jgi:hypothetical protein
MSRSGRPKVEDRRDAKIDTRTWPRLKDAVERSAADKGVTVARFVEDALIDALKREGRWPT